MRVVSLNQDKGIGPSRKKGAAVHLEAMRSAFARAGHAVVALDGEVAAESLDAALVGADLLYERYALGRTQGSAAAGRTGVPHVVELNAPLADEERMYRGGADDAGLRSDEEQVFSGAALVVAVSRQVAAYALERGAAPDRVLVRPNGVDATRFVPRGDGDALRRELVPEGRFALGFHGRLRPWHGLGLLGRATAALLSSGLPVHLVLVGEGDFEAALGGTVPREHVTRVPWVRHAAMPAYVAAFDALPLTYAPDGPSYFSPLKLAEAMACGVVPVFPPVGDLGELLSDGHDSLAYRAGDLDSLTSRLARLVEDQALWARLARAAITRARGQSWVAIAEDVVRAVSAGAAGGRAQ